MQFNKAIRKISEELSHKWNMWCPLAAGNCGMFAISLSRFLTEKKVPHKILIITVWDGQPKMSELTPTQIVDEGMPGNHYVIQVADKIVDFQGINPLDIIETYSASWFIGEMFPYVINGSLEDIEEAVVFNTGYRRRPEDYDDVIRKHFMA